MFTRPVCCCTKPQRYRDEFEPSSLRGFLCNFDRHLKAFKYPKNLIEDLEFEQILKALKARRRQLKKEGKGNTPNAAEVITAKRGGQHSIHEKPAWNHECSGFAEHVVVYELHSFRVERLRRTPKNDLGRCSTYQRCGRYRIFRIF